MGHSEEEGLAVPAGAVSTVVYHMCIVQLYSTGRPGCVCRYWNEQVTVQQSKGVQLYSSCVQYRSKVQVYMFTGVHVYRCLYVYVYRCTLVQMYSD